MAKKLSTTAAAHLLERAGDSDDVESLFAGGLQNSDYVVRYVSAIRLCELRPDLMTAHAIGDLFLTLNETYRQDGHPMPITEAYMTVSDGGDLQQDTVLALASLGHNQYERTTVYIPRLIEFFSRDPQFYELAHLIVSMTFANTDQAMLPSEVTETQKRVLDALTANEPIWGHDGDWPEILESVGLPTTQDDVRALACSR